MVDSSDQAAGRLREAKRVTVLTGAGISAESGIATFRDAMTGLWSQFNPADLATPEAFRRDPELVSRWYDERRLQVAGCRPNDGHLALARMERIAGARGVKFTLITQNVDRLHQAAGSQSVIELHGTLWVWRCVDCGKEAEETGPAFSEYPPTCICGGSRRPGVVWFGEGLNWRDLSAAGVAAKACDLLISVGTSSVVYPAARLIEDAIAAGAKVLEVNPNPTPFSDEVDWSIRGKSGEVLPRLVEEAFGNGVDAHRIDSSAG